MEYITIALIICLLVCLVILVFLIKKLFDRSEENAYQILLNNKEDAIRNEAFDKQMKQSFTYILNQVHELRKDQALSKQTMDIVENNIRSMNQVMSNVKTRGNWGEYQLDMLLQIYAAKNPSVYSTQYMLSNGKIADAVLHMPQDNRILCIDSKFPMENYLNFIDQGDMAQIKTFKANVKKHIDDIAIKYINMQTVDYAIMFIPSEAIYQFICSECIDSLNYALKKHVMMTSPTTLVGTIYTLMASTKDFYRATNIQDIEHNILLLKEDMDRLVTRSKKAERSLESLMEQFHQVSVSASKMASRVNKWTDGKEEEV